MKIIYGSVPDWGGQPNQVPAFRIRFDDEAVRGLGVETATEWGQNQWGREEEERARAGGEAQPKFLLLKWVEGFYIQILVDLGF